MGNEVVLFKSEEKMTRRDAAELLRTIADKIDKGKITLSQGKKKVELKIPGRVEVELKAEKETGKKKTTKKLEVEIEWLVGGKDMKAGPMKVK